MKQNQDIIARFPGTLIIHQRIRDYSVKPHTHADHELFLPLQGEIQVEVNQTYFKAGPGKMLYLPPDTLHSFRSSKNSEGERLIFLLDKKIWSANEGGTFDTKVISTSQLCKELLFHLLLNPKTKAAKSLLQTLVQTVSEMLESSGFGNIEKISHLFGKSQDERIQRALYFISKNFAENISSRQLAKLAAMSIRTQNRLFLTELGLSPKQVIALFRVERAKKLLLQRPSSVTDVALEVGYQSVSQFISVFRRITGQLPSEFLN